MAGSTGGICERTLPSPFKPTATAIDFNLAGPILWTTTMHTAAFTSAAIVCLVATLLVLVRDVGSWQGPPRPMRAVVGTPRRQVPGVDSAAAHAQQQWQGRGRDGVIVHSGVGSIVDRLTETLTTLFARGE